MSVASSLRSRILIFKGPCHEATLHVGPCVALKFGSLLGDEGLQGLYEKSLVGIRTERPVEDCYSLRGNKHPKVYLEVHGTF